MAASARNPGKSYADFHHHDLIAPHSDKTVNKFDLYCPQESCRSKILLASAATLVEREKNKLTLPTLPLAGVSTIDDHLNDNVPASNEKETNGTTTDLDSSAEIRSAEELQSFWRVADMMAFENIGFSRKLPNGIQFLSCADCDIGPLGYYETTRPDKEYLIAVNRVRYHDRA